MLRRRCALVDSHLGCSAILKKKMPSESFFETLMIHSDVAVGFDGLVVNVIMITFDQHALKDGLIKETVGLVDAIYDMHYI